MTSATATPKPKARREHQLAGGDVVKRRLTTAEAAEQWVRAREDEARAKALKDEAAEVLVAYFERTGRTTYKGRIAYTQPPARRVLDQEAVKTFLGARLGEFMRTVVPKKSLSLLK